MDICLESFLKKLSNVFLKITCSCQNFWNVFWQYSEAVGQNGARLKLLNQALILETCQRRPKNSILEHFHKTLAEIEEMIQPKMRCKSFKRQIKVLLETFFWFSTNSNHCGAYQGNSYSSFKNLSTGLQTQTILILSANTLNNSLSLLEVHWHKHIAFFPPYWTLIGSLLKSRYVYPRSLWKYYWQMFLATILIEMQKVKNI